jgi:predicted O-methyltransferase YrrM
VPYINAITSIEDNSLDFVLVDGKQRAQCALASLMKLRPGGILIVDDVHRYFPAESSLPMLASFAGTNRTKCGLRLPKE